MKNRKMLLVASLVLALAMSLGGTLAYLTDTDDAVNVMTLGNVNIEQWENGKPHGFIQGQALYPAHYTEEEFENATTIIGGIEKRVDVKNIGSSDAYVRTVFAFEVGDLTEEEFLSDLHFQWYKNDAENVDVAAALQWAKDTAGKLIPVSIKDSKYYLAWYVYPEKIAANAQAGETLQGVVMDKHADNDTVAALGETYEILVVSQACQTVNFEDLGAAGALDVAFKALSAQSHPWIDLDDPTNENDQEPDGVKTPVLVKTIDEMRAAMKIPGVKIVLADDLKADDDKGTGYCLYAKYDCEIDLNGHDIIVDLSGKEFYGVIYALNGAQVDIVGEGDILIDGGVGPFIWCTGSNGATAVNIYGGNWTQDSADFGAANYCEGLYANRAGAVNIYGGVFNWKGFEQYTINESREGVVTVYGGTFINFDPSSANDGSYVAEGYKVVSETQANGDIWYTVIPE